MTTAYNPFCNGLVERANRTIGEILRICRHKSLEHLHKSIGIRLNHTYHSAIGKTPYQASKEPFLVQKVNNNGLNRTNNIKNLHIGTEIFIKTFSTQKTSPI